MATQPDQVNSGALATMFALTALATVATALGVTALVRSEQEELAQVRDEPITRAYRSHRASQERELNGPPVWVDRKQGLVSVPIDRAIELTLKDIRQGRTVVGPQKAAEDSGPETDPEQGSTEEAPLPEADPAEVDMSPAPEGSPDLVAPQGGSSEGSSPAPRSTPPGAAPSGVQPESGSGSAPPPSERPEDSQ